MKKSMIRHWDVLLSSSFIILFIYALPISAVESSYQCTLTENIQDALINNPAIKARQEAIEAARYSKKQACANLLPRLSTSYEYTHVKEKDYLWPDFPVTTNENYQWKATLEQPVFNGFALINTVKLAGVGQDLAETEFEIEKLDLALKVKQTYFNILKTGQNLDVAAQAVKSIGAHVTVAHSFFEVGKIPAHDLLEAEVRYANAQEELIHAQNAVHIARATFNMLLARSLETPFTIADILTYKPLSDTYEVYLKQALNKRLELKAIDLSLQRTVLEEQIAKSAYYPEVSLRYDYIKEGDTPDVAGSDYHKKDYWEASAFLTWYFWEWGKTHYSVRQKQSRKKQLQHIRAMAADKIRLEIKEALLALERVEKKIPTTRKAVKLAEENLRIKQKRYQMQLTTSTEVLDAQTLLSEALNHYHNALYDHNLAKARLSRAVGDY